MQAFLVAQTVNNIPAIQEIWVWSLGWEESQEKGMATHSRILAWRTSWTEEPDRLQSMGVQSQTRLSNQHFHSLQSACVLSCVRLFATLWTVAHQTLVSVGFSRQEYWTGLPFPPSGDLPESEIKTASPVSPTLQADSLVLNHWIEASSLGESVYRRPSGLMGTMQKRTTNSFLNYCDISNVT